MKYLLRVASFAALVLIAGVAYANISEFKFENGECENGNRWWSVTEFYGGQLVEVSGVGCDGLPYIRRPNTEIVTADPTVGLSGGASVFTGEGWHAAVRYDVQRRIVWAGGQDVQGNYWVWENFSEDVGPGDNLQ